MKTTTASPPKETQAEKVKRIKVAQAELKKEEDKKKKLFTDLVKERIRVTKVWEKAKENADTLSIAVKNARDAQLKSQEIEIVLQRAERLESGEDKKGMAAHITIMQKIK